jgi:hypothetical protein
MKWKPWLKGLAAVAVGGAFTGAADAVGKGQLNKNTAMIAGVGAITTVVAYLLQSPLFQNAAAYEPAKEQPAASEAVK